MLPMMLLPAMSLPTAKATSFGRCVKLVGTPAHRGCGQRASLFGTSMPTTEILSKWARCTTRRAEREGDVVGKVRDLGELHALIERKFIACDAGAAHHVARAGVHAEALERFGKAAGVVAQLRAHHGARAALVEQCDGRKVYSGMSCSSSDSISPVTFSASAATSSGAEGLADTLAAG